MVKKKSDKIIHKELKKNWFWIFCGLSIFVAAIFRAKWVLVALNSVLRSWPETEGRLRRLFKRI